MLTSCPECVTTFRVTQEQLGARRGMVRCGHCNAVFNAYDNLQAEIEAPTPPEGEAPLAEPGRIPEAPPAYPADVGESMPPQEEAYSQGASAYRNLDADTSATDEPPSWLTEAGDDTVELETTALPEPPASLPHGAVDDILLSELPVRRARVADTALGARLLQGVLAAILFLALLGQTAFFLRGELVTWLPELRPTLIVACRALGCELPLSRDLDALNVEASSLETDPEKAAHARLRVTFSNRSTHLQAWPYFTLKLSDVHNVAMAQRVFKPSEYLPKGRGISGGMPARSELDFQLDLDLGTLAAAGYEVKPYYP